jgi:hypothetical protein
MKARRSVDNKKHQQPQTVRPQRSKISTRKQNTSKTLGQLNRVGPTFDQLLAKYMKKTIPHNQPIKQSQKHPKGSAAKIAWSSSSRDGMVLPGLSIVDVLSYSSVGWYDIESILLAQSICLFGLGAPQVFAY